MDIQQSVPDSRPPPNSLPYQQLVFIHTQTIGLQKQLKQNTNGSGIVSEQRWNKQYKYRDILVPVSVKNVDRLYLYYLYHVGPVYNWLRDLRVFGKQDVSVMDGKDGSGRVRGGCYQRQLLQQYISNKMNTSKNTVTKYKQTKQQQLQVSNIKQLLIQYGKKWQIMKLCLFTKIFITKPSQSQMCRHMIKLQTWAQHYSYNNRTQQLQIYKYYCKQCNKYVNTHNNYYIQSYPLAPMFCHYYGLTITVKINNNNKDKDRKDGNKDSNKINNNIKNNNNKQKYKQKQKQIRYVLNIVYGNKYVLVKSANGLWYKCDINTNNNNVNNVNNVNMNMVGQMQIFNNIQTILKNNKLNSNSKDNNLALYVYVRQEITTNCGILKHAISVNTTFNQHIYDHITANNIDDIFNTSKYNKNNKIKNINTKLSNSNIKLLNNNSFGNRILKQSEQHLKHPKQYQQNIFKHDLQLNTNKNTKVKNNTKQQQFPQQQQIRKQKQNKREIKLMQPENGQQLEEIGQEKHNHIVIDKSLGEAGDKYRQQVQKLYIKPKQKDQYQKQYDKGKTKKIKKKHQYIKPNYNQLFKQVKKEHVQTAKIADQAQKEGLTFRQKQKAIEKQKNKQNKQQEGKHRFQGRQRDQNRKFGGRQGHKQWKKKKRQIFVKKFQQS